MKQILDLPEDYNFMPEIAYTPLGRNALFTGLVCHFAALPVAMLSASGTAYFFSIVFSVSCLLLVAGAFTELKNRGDYPLKDLKFYMIVASTVFPVLGPFIVLGLLYSLQKCGQEKRIGMSGLFRAFIKLRANGLVLFVLMAVLLFLFVATNSPDDPYYKKRHLNDQKKHVPQSVLMAGLYSNIIGTAGMSGR